MIERFRTLDHIHRYYIRLPSKTSRSVQNFETHPKPLTGLMYSSEMQESIRILLIEEEVLVRDALKALLASWELNVCDVANADETSSHIRHFKFDIVLLSLGGNEELDSDIVRDVVAACG